MNQFRIGACYRDKEGDLIRLCPQDGRVGAEFLLTSGRWERHGGLFDLATGECEKYSWCDLLPQEYDDSGNPVSEQKAETVGEFVDFLEEAFPDKATDPNAAMLARDAAAMQRAKPQQPEQRKPAAKPFPLTISPDLAPTSHLVCPNFGSAHLKG